MLAHRYNSGVTRCTVAICNFSYHSQHLCLTCAAQPSLGRRCCRTLWNELREQF